MHSKKVGEIMSSPAVTLQADHSASLAEGIMRSRHIRHLPVVDAAGVLVGLISHRDVAQAVAAFLARPLAAGDGANLSIPVGQIMQTEVWTVSPSTPLLEAARILRDHRIGCLPVCGDGGRVVGIITAADFLSALIAHLERRREREDTDPSLRITPRPGDGD